MTGMCVYVCVCAGFVKEGPAPRSILCPGPSRLLNAESIHRCQLMQKEHWLEDLLPPTLLPLPPPLDYHVDTKHTTCKIDPHQFSQENPGQWRRRWFSSKEKQRSLLPAVEADGFHGELGKVGAVRIGCLSCSMGQWHGVRVWQGLGPDSKHNPHTGCLPTIQGVPSHRIRYHYTSDESIH